MAQTRKEKRKRKGRRKGHGASSNICRTDFVADIVHAEGVFSVEESVKRCGRSRLARAIKKLERERILWLENDIDWGSALIVKSKTKGFSIE